jgi:hypothetical protein
LEHLALRGVPKLFWCHYPAGGVRSKVEARILKGLGAKAGIPDLLLLHGGQLYAIELKAPGRKPTEVQINTMAEMLAAGAIVEVATGLDEAIAMLEQWGLLRGQMQ